MNSCAFLSHDAMYRARYCYGKSSVRPSVRDVRVVLNDHTSWNISK